MATSLTSPDSVPRREASRIEVVVLHKAVYDKFEAQFRPVQPNEQTTAIQVGYALGVQAVLKALRAGLVAE